MRANIIPSIIQILQAKQFELTTFDADIIDYDNLCGIITDDEFHNDTQLQFLVMVSGLLCGHYLSKYQLHLLRTADYSFSEIKHNVVNIISTVRLIAQKDMFVLHDHHAVNGIDFD